MERTKEKEETLFYSGRRLECCCFDRKERDTIYQTTFAQSRGRADGAGRDRGGESKDWQVTLLLASSSLTHFLSISRKGTKNGFSRRLNLGEVFRVRHDARSTSRHDDDSTFFAPPL